MLACLVADRFAELEDQEVDSNTQYAVTLPDRVPIEVYAVQFKLALSTAESCPSAIHITYSEPDDQGSLDSSASLPVEVCLS